MDASEVYDRQIRLWGMEAQKRMQEARVLFCGLRALPAEICKNVILAGINVALLDAETVTHEDLCAQFFLRPEHVGMNRAEACLPGVREMNPLATVECHTSPPSSLPDTFFSSFDIIVASDLPPSQLIRLDALMRERGREAGRGGGFMYADTFGLHGWAFVDLGEGFKGRMDEASKGGAGPGEKEGGKTPAYVMARTLFSHPEIHDPAEQSFKWTEPNEAGLEEFLIDNLGFNPDRVKSGIAKLKASRGAMQQKRLDSFFKPSGSTSSSSSALKRKEAPAVGKGKGKGKAGGKKR
ncbi:hypothetical protein VYU27_007305 [Nannochloropsis oceanica]